MQTSVIRYRVADFLKRHAPFDGLAEPDLLELAGSGRVKFHESEEFIVQQGQPKGRLVWVIQQGRVELVAEHPAGPQLRDVLGEGDLLGLDRFVGDGAALCSARTATDVIVYSVDASVFESLVARYPSVKRHLAAHFSIVNGPGFGRSSWLDAEPPSLDFLRARGGGPPPAQTLAGPLTTRTAIRQLLGARAEAVAVDGAILTASDLALFCGHDPTRLIREIRNASSGAEWTPLLRLATRLVLDALAQPSDVDDCAFMTDEIARAYIEASAHPAPWLMHGAAARADGVGQFHGLPADSKALVEWKEFYSDTIRNPILSGLYGRREFFDLREFGGGPSLYEELAAYIIQELSRTTVVVPVLANDTLENLPPLTFFHGLVLDLDGGQSTTFDIESSALRPIVDAARVFAIARARLSPAGTLSRLAAAAADFPEHSAVLTAAAEAFRVAMYHYTLAGGAAIDPSKLGRYDQRLLKTAFLSIQQLLEVVTATFLRRA